MEYLSRDFLTGTVSPDTEKMPAIKDAPEFVSGNICAEVNALINFVPLDGAQKPVRPARRPSLWVDTVQTSGPARVKLVMPSSNPGYIIATCMTRKRIMDIELPSTYPFKLFFKLNL
jgi:hypothetical protein